MAPIFGYQWALGPLLFRSWAEHWSMNDHGSTLTAFKTFYLKKNYLFCRLKMADTSESEREAVENKHDGEDKDGVTEVKVLLSFIKSYLTGGA